MQLLKELLDTKKVHLKKIMLTIFIANIDQIIHKKKKLWQEIKKNFKNE
jgi:hypothetical protein